MFNRRKFIILAIALALILCMALMLRPSDAPRKSAVDARRQLREQGFKTDLSDFNFTTSPEIRRREAILTNALLIAQPINLTAPIRYLSATQIPDFMPLIGNDAAEVVAREEIVDVETKEALWDTLRNVFIPFDPGLDAACQAICEGPIAFNLNAQAGQHMLLPHVATLKRLEQHLATRAALDLHDGKGAAAWTNLLASTRLITAWQPEPVEISHLVRWSCAQIAFNLTWQAFHSAEWSDAQLARLETEWKSTDFFTSLPDCVAFTRASWVDFCIQQREQPSLSGLPVSQTLRSPREAFYDIQRRAADARYRTYGSYEDERDLLFFYRDRESDLRRALRAPTWAEMRQAPAITNETVSKSKHNSTLSFLTNTKQTTLGMMGRGASAFARCAEAEARRRLLLTAIALEQHKLRAGSYPRSLNELNGSTAEGAGANFSVDFMDGKLLRYRPTQDGSFVLYSVGLDCTDNGGIAGDNPERLPLRGTPPPGWGPQNGKDLVWPRPASEQEVKVQEQREIEEEKRRPLYPPLRRPRRH